MVFPFLVAGHDGKVFQWRETEYSGFVMPVNVGFVIGNGCESRESCDQLATIDHWVTSSARSNSDCGIVIPSALAVLRLITSSNLVGCSTGSSPGFAPLKILSTKLANRK